MKAKRITDAELQAITRMCETAHAVSERLLRAISRGSLRTPVNLRSFVCSGSQCTVVGRTKMWRVYEASPDSEEVLNI